MLGERERTLETRLPITTSSPGAEETLRFSGNKIKELSRSLHEKKTGKIKATLHA